jgi:hypothetical protein
MDGFICGNKYLKYQLFDILVAYEGGAFLLEISGNLDLSGLNKSIVVLSPVLAVSWAWAC